MGKFTENLKKSVFAFLKETFKDIAKDWIKGLILWVGSISLISVIALYFKKSLHVIFLNLIAFLNLKTQMGIAIAVALTACLIGIRIGRPKKQKFKPYFYKYGGVKWRVVSFDSPEDYNVENEPYCPECEVKFVEKEGSFVFREPSIIICPGCAKKHFNYDTSEVHNAVENLIAAQILKQREQNG